MHGKYKILLPITDDNFNVNQQTWCLSVNTLPFLSVIKINEDFLSTHPTAYMNHTAK